mmetsp:Transcript_4632/g.16637  ORF Transcript_4632/g.16637 Transcript_4632/m.16637 type:complete len:274 (+) Transcript_4632:1008-1829(+)
MASNSSVASWPAVIRMDSAPPGWSARYSVASYTFPSCTNQADFSVLCLAISSSVYVLAAESKLFVGLCFASLAGSLAGSGAFGVGSVSFLGTIQPPGPFAATVGCSNWSARAPSCLMGWTLTLKWQLFIIPITFQVMSLGWVFIPSSHDLSEISSMPTRSSTLISSSQWHQHQYLPYALGFSVWCSLHRFQTLPPSKEISVRMTFLPPPEYAYPFSVYFWPSDPVSFRISSCCGYTIAELMFRSLMMYSGLYHHPSAVAFSASTWDGSTLLSK